jgi:predicted AlkP superfamily pyrophosphatase or phosphodiesterase
LISRQLIGSSSLSTKTAGAVLRILSLLALLAGLPAAARDDATRPDNSAAQIDKPYVLLISIDGYRYDYSDKFGASNLAALGKQGVRAKALVPEFPTLTFPNHYSIVTGLYPEHHGIVENSFWDPEFQAMFKFTNPADAGDGRWWGGTPLWVLAEQQGMRTAAYFWVGSEASIQGIRPSYYYVYNSKTTMDTEIDQAVEWLNLPKAQRPHLILLYLSKVDHLGHLHGPEAPETKEAVKEVDAALGHLFQRVHDTGLPVNIVVVSDHGMAQVSREIRFTAEEFDGAKFTAGTTQINVYSKDAAVIDKLYERFMHKDEQLAVYRKPDIPSALHYRDNSRIGDLVLLAQSPVRLRYDAPGAKPSGKVEGMHGYDVAHVPEMNGIFYAQGPAIQDNLVIEEFQNIHIYPFIARILGLQTGKIDGDLQVLGRILKKGF